MKGNVAFYYVEKLEAELWVIDEDVAFLMMNLIHILEEPEVLLIENTFEGMRFRLDFCL